MTGLAGIRALAGRGLSLVRLVGRRHGEMLGLQLPRRARRCDRKGPETCRARPGVADSACSTTRRSQSSALTGVAAIAAGTYRSFTLLLGGTVKCWGYNADGPTRRRNRQDVGGTGERAWTCRGVRDREQAESRRALLTNRHGEVLGQPLQADADDRHRFHERR